MAAGATQRRVSWAQPSLSRDFALLSAAIFFLMLMVLAWVSWITYASHSERIIKELDKETDRIERMLESQITDTGHLLQAMGRQIAKGRRPDDLQSIAQMLQAFAGGDQQYALWGWTDTSHRFMVGSNKGVLQQPVDISDRDYIKAAEAEPWKMHIGAPIEGRVSERWIIPMSVGVTDDTGKYLGAVQASIDIGVLTEQISQLVRRDGISFAIVSKDYIPLTVVADSEAFSMSDAQIRRLKEIDPEKQPKGIISQAGLFTGGDIYSYYLISPKYPYIIVVGYNNRVSDTAMRSLLWPRIIQICVVAGFMLLLLWIIRSRVIKPVAELGVIAARVARGGEYRALKRSGPHEIEQLSTHLSLIGDYIAERHLVEEELRTKIVHLHQHQQAIQMEVRQRAALLAGLLGEYKKSLRNINSHAQMIKDQIYGPIDEKKYRSCASDIHQSGTTLELMVRKLIALSRVDAAGIVMRDEPVKLEALLEGARHFAVEGMEGSGAFAWHLPEESSGNIMLQLDGLHAQQALGYVLLYLLAGHQSEAFVELRLMRIPAKKGEEDLVLVLGLGAAEDLTADAVRQAIEAAGTESLPLPTEDTLMDELHITLAKAMLALQHITLAVVHGHEAQQRVLVSFPAKRLFVAKQEEGQ